MNKDMDFDFLKLIEHTLRDYDHPGSPPVLLNMVNAIKQIVETIRANPSTRFGSCLTSSKNNLSWVVHEALKPACENLWVLPNLNAVSVLTFIKVKAKPDEVFLAEDEIKRLLIRLPYLGKNSPEERALDLLYGTLCILRVHCSSRKNTKKSEDSPYCKYCYREAMQGANTCHIHNGHWRANGEYCYRRYKSLRYAVKEARLFDDWIEPRNYLPLTNDKLLEKGVSAWSNQGITKTEKWIAHVLEALDVCEPRARKKVAAKLVESEEFYGSTQLNACWPSAMKGTMFRHEIYLLAHLRIPAKATAGRLNRMWSGEAVSEVASASGVSRQALHKQKNKWEKSILDLRSKGVKDDVIKLVYHLNVLPQYVESP